MYNELVIGSLYINHYSFHISLVYRAVAISGYWSKMDRTMPLK